MDYKQFFLSFFFLPVFPVSPTCPPALPMNQSTVSHIDFYVIVTALLQALFHDPSVLMTSFAYKPCFCLLCPGHPLQNCCASYSLGLSQPRHSAHCSWPWPSPFNFTFQPPLATILPALVHHSSGHCTTLLWVSLEWPPHSCFRAWDSIAFLVLPMAFTHHAGHWIGWYQCLLYVWSLFQVLGQRQQNSNLVLLELAWQ